MFNFLFFNLLYVNYQDKEEVKLLSIQMVNEDNEDNEKMKVIMKVYFFIGQCG